MTPRHALVIGPHGSVGGAVARELRRRGARVAGAGRVDPGADAVDRFFALDVAAADWPALYAAAGADGPLDTIVYAAGHGAFGSAAAVPPERARTLFEVNFWGVAGAALAAFSLWNGGGRPACFLAVLSIAGRRAVPFEAHYGASKAAAQRFLEALQLEADPTVRFVAAAPGIVRSDFRARAGWFGEAVPETSYGASPEDTAAALCDLVEGTRRSRILGWRERAIDLGDRFLPGLYDRIVLRPRLARRRRP